MSVGTERMYRFAPRDRAGWILGLGATQCLTLAAGLVIGTVVVSSGAPVAVAVVPLVGAGLLAFGRWHGRPLHDWIPVLGSWTLLGLHRQRRWTARVPLLSESGTRTRATLPAFLAGLEILEASASWTRRRRLGSVGLIADRREHLLSGVLRIRGREFALIERASQDRLLAGWGEVLAGFCRERTSVARVAWSEWAAPAGLEDHLRFVEREAASAPGSLHRDAYDELLDGAGPMTTRHEVLLTVTIDIRRARINRTAKTPLDDALADLLLEELRLLTARIEDAGLTVDVPLSPGELREVLRVRLDPTVLQGFAARARAGFTDALVSEHNLGPIAVDLELEQREGRRLVPPRLLDRGVAAARAAPGMDGAAAVALGRCADDRDGVRAGGAVTVATPNRPRCHACSRQMRSSELSAAFASEHAIAARRPRSSSGRASLLPVTPSWSSRASSP